MEQDYTVEWCIDGKVRINYKLFDPPCVEPYVFILDHNEHIQRNLKKIVLCA